MMARERGEIDTQRENEGKERKEGVKEVGPGRGGGREREAEAEGILTMGRWISWPPRAGAGPLKT